jgi:hypothetical protein
MLEPKVSVLIVTYNSERYIAECIEALSSARTHLEVVIIDNASSDSTLRILASLDFATTVIANHDNLGFASAVNLGAKKARGATLLLLNPDCVLTGANLDVLIETLDANPDVGIVAPAIEHPSGRLTVRSAGFQPTIARMASQALGLAKSRALAQEFPGFNLYPAGEVGEETEVEWVSGACLAIRTQLWQSLNGLSERWFMYAEDIDLCRRVHNTANLKIIHTSRSRATHVVGASSETINGPVWTLWIENLADYYRLEFHPSAGQMLVWKFFTCAIYFSRAMVYGIRAVRARSNREDWKREQTKFNAYAMAVVKFK